ncbi:AHH domain-containing protein [Cystobacter fuscus]|uniref:AHH domain-containing protein n=1 Tax=Cystobacter fuscus TaxID=43 RepID=UPI000BB3ACFD
MHHIATVENSKSTARGGPWTQRFQELFDKAGMSMEAQANKVPLEGHKGPHPQAYHEAVYRRLRDATSTCRSTLDCRKALVTELRQMAQELTDRSSKLYKLLSEDARR